MLALAVMPVVFVLGEEISLRDGFFRYGDCKGLSLLIMLIRSEKCHSDVSSFGNRRSGTR